MSARLPQDVPVRQGRTCGAQVITEDKIEREEEKIKERGPIGALYLAVLFTAFVALPASLAAQVAGRSGAEAGEREATAFIREGNQEKAIEALRGAIKLDPSYAAAYIQLGYLLIKKGSLDDAFQTFGEALKINPALHDAKTGKGMVLLRKGDLKNAELVLKDALVLNPDPVRTHYELGNLYSRLGDTTKALAEYKEGIKKFRQGRK